MRFLSEMTPEQRQWREWEKRFCSRCRRWVRERASHQSFVVLWSGEQVLRRRRFVNAQIRITEELWICPRCPATPEGKEPSGMWIDFEHVGDPAEVITLE